MIATETISLRVKLGGAIATAESPITGHYVTMTNTGIVIGVQAIHSVTNGVTPVIITPNALNGYVNVLKNLQVSNADSVTTTVILEQYDGTTARIMSSSPLGVNQFLTLDSEGKITLSASGGIAGTGTVTQVQGNGTVNGLSLSGNITTSGNLTLSGNIPIANATTTGLLTSTDWLSFNSSSGLPAGGTTGQILGKLSATDGDAGWTNSIKGNVTISSSGAATDNKLTVQNDGTSDGNCSIVLRRNDADQGAITAIPGNGGLVLSHNHASGKIIFKTGLPNTEKFRVDYLGRFGIGIDTPTSFLHLKAGTTTANTSPMKFEDGVLMTTPEHGAVEFDGSNIWTTISGTRAKNIFSSNNLSALSTTTSAQLASVISDETGTGNLVFGTNCTLNTPNLTTPSFANLSSAIGLNLTSGVTAVLPAANGGINTASWVAWTPTFTNFTLGNGTLSAFYHRETGSKLVHYRIGIILGSTSAMGTNPVFTLPFTSVTQSIYSQIGYGLLLGATFLQAEVVWQSTTTAKITYGNPLTTITPTIPFSWAAGNEININGFYEAA